MIAGPVRDRVDDEGLTVGVIIAIAGALWSASGGMDGLIRGITIAYDEEVRSFPHRRGLALLLPVGAIVLLVQVTIVWLIGSAAFSFYVGTFGTYNQTYGPLAG